MEDHTDHAPYADDVAKMIADCRPPCVLGIHGDRGAGKTGFLRKLHLFMSCKDGAYEDAENTCTALWGTGLHSTTKSPRPVCIP
jgi:hypothetical protein